MRFRASIYIDIDINDTEFDWDSIEDVREVATIVANETIKFLSDECETGAYNPYLGGVAYFPIGCLPSQEELNRL